MKALVLSEISVALAGDEEIPLGAGRCSECSCPKGGMSLTASAEVTGRKVCVINSDAAPLRVEHRRGEEVAGLYQLTPAGSACAVCDRHRVRSGSSVVLELDDDERVVIGETATVPTLEAEGST